MNARATLFFACLFLCCGGSEPSTGSDGGTETSSVPAIQFPRDESPHSAPIEWWYYTGSLKADSGATFGFELVVFQGMVVGIPSYGAHYAITDQGKGTYQLATQTSLVDQRGATSGFDLQVGPWTMSGHAGEDTLSAQMPGYGLDIALTAKKPVVLQYGKGWMTIGSTNPFYYYSYTRMGVTGSLTVDSVKETVTGEAWMDHQWGDMGSDYVGWDWFSLRLDDLSELMLFVVRRAGKDGFYGGTLVGPNGSVQNLNQGDFTITAQGQWTSPHTQATYPQGWTIAVPAAAINVTITPVLPDQEFYESLAGSPIYWEGLCNITGTREGTPLGGSAYVELTGYKN